MSRADKLGSGDRTWTGITRRRRRDRCSGWCANFGSGAERPGNGFRPGGATIHIEDVDRFYKVYHAAGGHPTADQLQHDYLNPGSEGLHQFAKMRKISGAAISETLAKRPEIYSGAKRCARYPKKFMRLVNV